MEEPREIFKIWKNPAAPAEPPVFMGNFDPPEGQVCFYQRDLKELGFPRGDYTVRAPDSLRKIYALPEWQKITIL
jgi:hypothetical protein